MKRRNQNKLKGKIAPDEAKSRWPRMHSSPLGLWCANREVRVDNFGRAK